MKKWEEYKFKIKADYTPNTLPMNRLASYMAELSVMLGEFSFVHFHRLLPGCVSLVQRIDVAVAPKIKERATAIKHGEGSYEEKEAYRKINKMLLEDKGTGVLEEKSGAVILNFPEIEYEKLKLPSVQQQGEIEGELINIGGSLEIVPLQLSVEGRRISGFRAKRDVAKELSKHLFEQVRLSGSGRWERGIDEEWSLTDFFVDRFDLLEQSTLSQTIIALRGLKGDWGENALNELLESRHSEDED